MHIQKLYFLLSQIPVSLRQLPPLQLPTYLPTRHLSRYRGIDSQINRIRINIFNKYFKMVSNHLPHSFYCAAVCIAFSSLPPSLPLLLNNNYTKFVYIFAPQPHFPSTLLPLSRLYLPPLPLRMLSSSPITT
jgi:hypothetical protein